MPYNAKQYDAATDFVTAGDPNLSSSTWDQKRVSAYDLYEDIYRNATSTLRIVLRGDDQAPILMPNGRKICDATARFLCKNMDYYVDEGGDAGARQAVDDWWKDFFKREKVPSKFNSNKLWGLVRGDAIFYVYADTQKVSGKRISIRELDPRQVFEIEDTAYDCVGVHIVDLIQDFRYPDQPDKQIVRRRTFRKYPENSPDPDATTIGISSELTHWELGKWDDRTDAARAKQQQVHYPGFDEPEEMLPPTITQLPTYKWSNIKAQNSSWGTSQIAGLETLLYALNQSLSDEDAALVFQGLGMYVTNAAPPIDPNTGDVTDWNIGPKQIIEISGDQKFERVTGVSDLSPFINHMDFISDNMAEGVGVPQVAVGRVDVAVAESGISLQLQLMPLIAQNMDKELEWVNTLDQLFHDITTQWLPGYEPEMFGGDIQTMTDITVVSIFDDPMPVDHTGKVQEIIQLDAAGLLLKIMVIQELRELGYRWPAVDQNGDPLTDYDLAQMLLDQTQQYASAQDPFSGQQAYDENGNPIQTDQQSNFTGANQSGQGPNGQANTPDSQTFSLGTS